jgi:hypothetical protein
MDLKLLNFGFYLTYKRLKDNSTTYNNKKDLQRFDGGWNDYNPMIVIQTFLEVHHIHGPYWLE